mmetsp:Transcript_38044/g.50102  ORF Transcript_38044/g.50102 Transcript_38044/m.50102 type:complete len:120 (-) Transcript_38044:97-456(-)
MHFCNATYFTTLRMLGLVIVGKETRTETKEPQKVKTSPANNTWCNQQNSTRQLLCIVITSPPGTQGALLSIDIWGAKRSLGYMRRREGCQGRTGRSFPSKFISWEQKLFDTFQHSGNCD